MSKLLRSRTATQWFYSVLMLLLPSFLLCAVISAYMLYLSANNVRDLNRSMAIQIQKSTDSRWEEVYRYALSIDITPKNVLLKRTTSPPAKIPGDAYKLSNSFDDYLVSNQFVQGIYIYYPQADLVVGDLGCYTPSCYFYLLGYPRTADYQSWFTRLSKVSEVFLLEPSEENGYRLLFIYPMRSSPAQSAVMVMEISQEVLYDSITTLTSSSESSSAILLNGVQISADHEQAGYLYDTYPESDSRFPLALNTEAVIPSEVMPQIAYASSYSNRDMLGHLWPPLLISLVGLLFTLLFSVAGTMRLIIRNHRPLQNIVDRLGGNQETAEEDDDYQFILDRLEEVSQKIYNNENAIRKGQALMYQFFLSSLLNDTAQSNTYFFEKARQLGITIDAAFYRVIVIQTPQDEAVLCSIRDKLEDYNFNTEDNSFATLYDQQIVLLLTSDDELTREAALTRLSSVREQICSGLAVNCGIGHDVDNLSRIHSSYRHALAALKSISGVNGIAFYSPGIDEEKDINPEVMQVFSDYVTTHRFMRALDITEQLLNEYILSEDAQMQTLRLDALISLLRDVSDPLMGREESRSEILHLIDSRKTMEEFQHTLESLLLKLQKSATDKGTKSKLPVPAQAKQFIDENYTNPMLGLYMIADHLNLNNSYISSAFKKEYGISTTQYINQKRIEKAKELILSTQMPIKQIAVQVGYSSDISFIRAYKRNEQETPTALRRNAAT